MDFSIWECASLTHATATLMKCITGSDIISDSSNSVQMCDGSFMNALWESCREFCRSRRFSCSQSLLSVSLCSRMTGSAARFLQQAALCGSSRASVRQKLRPLSALLSCWLAVHSFCFWGSAVRMRAEEAEPELSQSQSVMVTLVCGCSSVGFPGTDGIYSGMWVRLRFRHVWCQCLADPEHPGICETRDSRRAESCGAEPIHTTGPGHTSPGGRNEQ